MTVDVAETRKYIKKKKAGEVLEGRTMWGELSLLLEQELPFSGAVLSQSPTD